MWITTYKLRGRKHGSDEVVEWRKGLVGAEAVATALKKAQEERPELDWEPRLHTARFVEVE